MAEKKEETKKDSTQTASNNNAADNRNLRRNTSKVRPKRKNDRKRGRDEDDGFDTKIINIRRVTRMYKGGRRMRLSVFVVVGDRDGKVGVGIGKGPDVRSAQNKAVAAAKKSLVSIPLNGNTIPHDITFKTGAARVMLKPAAPGTGIVAGSSMRAVAEVAGIKDMLGKIMGTNNKISNAYATVDALASLKSKRN